MTMLRILGTKIPKKKIGMISHKNSLITIFGRKHKIKNFIEKFEIFIKRMQFIYFS